MAARNLIRRTVVVGGDRRWGDRFVWLGIVLCGLSGALLTPSGCQRSSTEAAASEDTAAVPSPYAPQDGIETPFQPATSRVRHAQMLTRHVRHRHAGPR